MKKLYSLLTMAALTTSGMAQNGFTTYTATTQPFSTQKKTLLYDGTYLWTGSGITTATAAGLIRFDGTNYVYYNTSNAQLASNVVNALERDNANNRLWVGTENGLYVYNGSALAPASFTLANTAVQSLKYKNGDLWIGTKGGLFKYDGTNVTAFTVANSGLPSDTITAIDFDNASMMWLSSHKKLISFNGTSTFNTVYDFGSQVSRINDVVVDANNRKWLSVASGGRSIFIYETSMEAFTSKYNLTGTVRPYQGAIQLSTGPNNSIVIPGDKGILTVSMDDHVTQYATNNGVATINVTYDASSGLYFMTTGGSPMLKLDPTQYNPFAAFGNGANNDNIKYLDVNQVKALVSNRGDMHWDLGSTTDAAYEVPKGSGRNSNFASAIWFGGYDNSNQLKVAAQTYRQSGSDFFPGPLNSMGATDSTTAAKYDKIWKIDYRDVNDFINNYNAGNVQNGTYVPSAEILSYPAKGNNGQLIALAPFMDMDGNGSYNPVTGGDYPQVTGDQMLYSVYNDKLSTHGETNSLALGIEVQSTSYAYGCPSVISNHNELNFTTFYKYKIINKSISNYHDCTMSFWTDADVGCYQDDYIGCNVPNNFGYIYNSDAFDENCAGNGYGDYPPVQSVQVLKGPLADADGLDNDNDGTIDEAGEQALMNYFMYYNNNLGGVQPAVINPQSSAEYFGYMNSIWRDGTPLTCGGSGYGGSTTTSFAFPGTTNPTGSCGASSWSETAGPTDRRFILSTGKFNLGIGDTLEFEYALVTTFDSTSTGNSPATIAKNVLDNINVRNFYQLSNKPNCLAGPVSVKELQEVQDLLQLYPNPATAEINITYYNPKLSKTHQLEVYNTTGQLVLSDELKTNVSKQINTQALPPGVYIIRVQGANGFTTQRFVKQ